jgi:acyl-CoA thioester hydrolase
VGELVLPVRVYLEDTDAQGVVYNASYFRFMERARTEWLRKQGVDHDELLERFGVLLVLARVEARFQAPARLSDMLNVGARVCEARGARVVFLHEIFVDRSGVHRSGVSKDADESGGDAVEGRLVCRGTAEVVCMDARHGKPRRIPATLLSEWNK